jgi:hypothetical protein
MGRKTLLTMVAGCWLGLGVGTATAQEVDHATRVVTDGAPAEGERRAIGAALQLLPRRPATVAVIDAERTRPGVREGLLKLDGFTVPGSRVVYLMRQSELLRGAAEGTAFHVHAVAAVIWHEMAHAEGADEREAQRREEALWTGFVRDQRLDQLTALRYLRAMSGRAHAAFQAAR